MAALKKQVIATAASLLLGGPTSVAAVKSGVFHHDTDSTSTNAGASTTKPAPTKRTNASQATPVAKKNGVTVIDVDANGNPISGARSGGGSGSTGGSGSSGGSGGASSGSGSSSTGSGNSGSGSGGSSSSTPGSTTPSTTGSAPGTPSSSGGNCTTTVKAQSDNKRKDSDDDKKSSGSSKGRESDDHDDDDDDDDRDHPKPCTTLPPVTTVKPPVTTTKPPVTTAPPTTAPPTTAPPTTAPPTTAPPTTAPAPALTLSQNFTSVTKGSALGFTTTVANNQATDANVSLTIKVSSATLPNYLEALGTGWSCSAYVAKPVATATYTCTGTVAAKSSSVVTVSSGSLIPASAAGQSITASATATPGNVTVTKTAVYA